MPTRKRKSSYKRRGARRPSYRRRRTSYKKKSWGNRITTRRAPADLFADQVFIVLKSAFIWEPSTSVITGGESLALEVTNLFDPSGALGSRQPLGLQNLVGTRGMYNKYILNGASISIKAQPADPLVFEDLVYTVHPTNNTPYSETSYSTRFPLEIPMAKSTTVIFRVEKPMTVKHYMSSKKITGGQMHKHNAASVGTVTTAGVITPPTYTWYWNIRAWNPWNPTNNTTGRCMIFLKQYVCLFNKKDIEF